MSTTELIFTVGLLVFLIGTPLLIALIVRLFVRDEPEAEAELEPMPISNFETLGDFWAGMVPHLRELQSRLIKAAVAIAIGTAIGFYLVSSPTLLGAPLPIVLIKHFVPSNVELQYIATAEGFVNYMRIALVIGVAIAMPVVIYQVIAF